MSLIFDCKNCKTQEPIEVSLLSSSGFMLRCSVCQTEFEFQTHNESEGQNSALRSQLADTEKALARAVEEKDLYLAAQHRLLEQSEEAGVILRNEDGQRFWRNHRAEVAEKALAEAKGLSSDVLVMCKKRGWSLHWTARGAYLHLEASELIESIRGKHGVPLEEAADVLLVLMSITEAFGMPWESVVNQARMTVDELMTKPSYPGEEVEQ